MCGISVIYNFHPDDSVDREAILRMKDSMRHRGPDDSGVLLEGNVALGHRRLSVVDLSPNGRQPMSNEDGRHWVTFNGEIYNHDELRRELTGSGHIFKSRSDTEVIPHLYEDLGESCLDRLNGMFAFAIWDRSERALFLARDRFGIKPLYYVQTPTGFLAASEIKAFFAAGLVTPELNQEGLADYLTFQLCLDGKTMFRGIRQLPPGHWMRVDSNGVSVPHPYWRLDYRADPTFESSHDFEERTLSLLREAVDRRLRADVPVGAHLSGGLDSSTVTCLAAQSLENSFHAFTGAFHEGRDYDESRYAKLVARETKTIHHLTHPSADDFVATLPALIYHMDEPAAGPGLFPQYMVSRLASENVKVVLGGQGGDELFGGYIRYILAMLETALHGAIENGHGPPVNHKIPIQSVLDGLPQLRRYRPLLRRFWSDGLFEPLDRRYFRLIERSSDVSDLMAKDTIGHGGHYDPFATYQTMFELDKDLDSLTAMMSFDTRVILPALLQVEDRTSMAVSLESRVPFLDHHLAEFVARIPAMAKCRGGEAKHLLREIARPIIPPEIHARQDKMGFPVPLREWYQKGPVRDFVHDVLLSKTAKERGVLRPTMIEKRLDSEQPYGRGLWGVLCLELWFRAFMDQPRGNTSAATAVNSEFEMRNSFS